MLVYVCVIKVFGLNQKIMVEFCMHTVCYGTHMSKKSATYLYTVWAFVYCCTYVFTQLDSTEIDVAAVFSSC